MKNLKSALISLSIVLTFTTLCFSTPVTKTYQFLPDQSTVSWSFGIRGPSYTTSVSGTFNLTLDPDQTLPAPTPDQPNPYYYRSYINNVNAQMADEVQYPFNKYDGILYRYTQSLDELFKLSSMICTEMNHLSLLDDGIAFDFKHMPSDYEFLKLRGRVIVYDDYIRISAYTLPYASNSPGWGFDAIAVEIPEPTTLLLFSLGLISIFKKS